MLYVFFWSIPRCLRFICHRFGTICLFHLHRRVGMKVEQRECSETSACKIQSPGNYPEESIQDSEQGRSLKSIRQRVLCARVCTCVHVSYSYRVQIALASNYLLRRKYYFFLCKITFRCPKWGAAFPKAVAVSSMF